MSPTKDNRIASTDATPHVLGHVARMLRIEAGVTLRELSAFTGITGVNIGRLERGLWAPDARQLAAIFKAIADAQDSHTKQAVVLAMSTRKTARGEAIALSLMSAILLGASIAFSVWPDGMYPGTFEGLVLAALHTLVGSRAWEARRRGRGTVVNFSAGYTVGIDERPPPGAGGS